MCFEDPEILRTRIKLLHFHDDLLLSHHDSVVRRSSTVRRYSGACDASLRAKQLEQVLRDSTKRHLNHRARLSGA